MRCKKHAADGSSSVGVCASCLRERLLAVMEAQAQRQAERHPQPPPISFPRSVSPYISRRKSDTAGATWRINGRGHGNHGQLFYSTPQVGPTGSLTVEIKNSNRKSRGGRFSSLFSGLFRSKSDKMDLESGGDSCTSSPSWFSTMISGGRKKQIRTFSVDENAIGARRKSCRIRDRGMSPARCSDDEDEDEEHFRGGSSGYSSESSQGWRRTPRRTPAATRRGGGNCKNVSGLTFCLSPLVRASPNRPWNQKGLPPDMAVGGDSRVPAKPHLSTTASFCKNRSRKLADFGRYSYNSNR